MTLDKSPGDESESDLYEQAPCGYLSTLPDGLVVKVNQTFLSWLGRERESLVGRQRFQGLLSLPGQIFYQSHFHPMLLAQGRVDEIALDLRLPDGDTLPALITGVLIRDAGGSPALMRLTVFNATERRAYERALVKKNKDLELLNTRKNELLGMAAHDLRSPVGAIYSYSTLLASEIGPSLSPVHREFLDNIIELSAFMSGLVTDILDVSSIESGSLRLERKSQPILPALRRNIGINAMLARKKGIAVESDLEAGDVFCLFDAWKIDQVLNNLLGNAIKFSSFNTTVKVSLTRSPEQVTIAISDQGPGIPAAESERIFAPFRTGSARGTAGERSTGLGLAIAHSIVAGHGGRIWVESAAGAGSTFSFTLPTSAPPPAREQPDAGPQEGGPRAVRVLLADDNGINQRIGKIMLSKLGATVSLAGSGREAVALLEQDDFDLVLMDCQMPEMDGYEATAAIRSIEKQAGNRRHVPIIAMTAGSADDRRRCLDVGMDDFLQKPAREQQLSEIIQRWVP